MGMTSGTRIGRRRANREGSIYQVGSRTGKKDGRWRGALTWTDLDGTRRRKVISGKTQADVRQRIAALRADLDKGLEPARRTTLSVFLDDWLEASRQSIRPATYRQYESIVRVHLKAALGTTLLERLTPTMVEKMTAGMINSGSSPRTAALARAVLRAALEKAQRDGLVHRNVAKLARAPEVSRRALLAGRDFLLAEDVKRLISGTKLHALGPLVALAATTGLRQGEILGLSWRDVDMDGATLTVRRTLAHAYGGGFALAESTKTAESQRTIDLPAAAVEALRRQKALQEAARDAAGKAWQGEKDDLVFTDQLGRHLVPYDVSHGFHRILEAAGVPRIPFHGLRHSAATLMLAQGTPLKVVSEHLGHSSITITADRYAGVVPAQRREAAAAVDRALGT